MRSFIAALAVSLAAPAAAEAPVARPAKKAEPCKKIVVGKGLDRKVVCEFTAPIIVTAGAPKPNVLIVPRGGRAVTGRPKSEDRLQGLGPHTK